MCNMLPSYATAHSINRVMQCIGKAANSAEILKECYAVRRSALQGLGSIMLCRYFANQLIWQRGMDSGEGVQQVVFSRTEVG